MFSICFSPSAPLIVTIGGFKTRTPSALQIAARVWPTGALLGLHGLKTQVSSQRLLGPCNIRSKIPVEYHGTCESGLTRGPIWFHMQLSCKLLLHQSAQSSENDLRPRLRCSILAQLARGSLFEALGLGDIAWANRSGPPGLQVSQVSHSRVSHTGVASACPPSSWFTSCSGGVRGGSWGIPVPAYQPKTPGTPRQPHHGTLIPTP